MALEHQIVIPKITSLCCWVSHRYYYNWKNWRTCDFSQYSKSYFHHILSLLSQCNQSHRAFKLVGPAETELFEINVFEDIIFHSLRNFEMKENSSLVEENQDEIWTYWIESYNILLAAYPCVKKIIIFCFLFWVLIMY